MEAYSKEKHYSQLERWFLVRKLPVPRHWVFSDLGFIEPEVMAGFLYITNSGIGQIDSFISNPKASKEDRVAAFDKIMQRLITEAHTQEVKMLVCSSNIRHTQDKAKKFGFKEGERFTGFTKEILHG